MLEEASPTYVGVRLPDMRKTEEPVETGIISLVYDDFKSHTKCLRSCPLTVGSYRKQTPTQKSSGNVLKAMPLKDKRGEQETARRRSDSCRFDTCEKRGRRKEYRLEKASDNRGPLRKSQPLDPRHKDCLGGVCLRQKWPDPVLPPCTMYKFA